MPRIYDRMQLNHAIQRNDEILKKGWWIYRSMYGIMEWGTSIQLIEIQLLGGGSGPLAKHSDVILAVVFVLSLQGYLSKRV